MIKIGTIRGFTIIYDESRRLFVLHDTQNDEVASGATQADLELKAKELSRQAFKFPIPALKVSGLSLDQGRVTSVNMDDQSAYFAFDNKTYQHHSKLHLRSADAYELTEANSRICAEVAKSQEQIKEIQDPGGYNRCCSSFHKPIP
ncbi:unnamed protein product [marine sediment metagenome]|uniref:Uncharacterized protein n=1 Tax=marine sediment metagenome TaxID=412755 RepID=X1LK88_9ZZZZ